VYNCTQLYVEPSAVALYCIGLLTTIRSIRYFSYFSYAAIYILLSAITPLCCFVLIGYGTEAPIDITYLLTYLLNCSGFRHPTPLAYASATSIDLGSLQEGMKRLRKIGSEAATGESIPSSVIEQCQSVTSQDVKPGFNTIRKKFEGTDPPSAMSVFPANVSRAQGQFQGQTTATPVKGPKPLAVKQTHNNDASPQRPQLQKSIKDTKKDTDDEVNKYADER